MTTFLKHQIYTVFSFSFLKKFSIVLSEAGKHTKKTTGSKSILKSTLHDEISCYLSSNTQILHYKSNLKDRFKQAFNL